MRLFIRENFDRLTLEERRELMRLQMSPTYGTGSAYLPEDCRECSACGTPMLGSGMCHACYERYESLRLKALGGLEMDEEKDQGDGGLGSGRWMTDRSDPYYKD